MHISSYWTFHEKCCTHPVKLIVSYTEKKNWHWACFSMILEQYGLIFTTKIFVRPKLGLTTLTALLTWAEQISLMPEFLFYYAFLLRQRLDATFGELKILKHVLFVFLAAAVYLHSAIANASGGTCVVNLVLLWILLV